jgi:nucleotide-binding universal stress UspA family protein
MFQRLLVAIDNSPGSDVALSFAVALAKQSGASVHVLHVNEHVVAGGGVTLRTDEEVTRLLTEAIVRLREEGIRTSGSVRRAPYRHVAECIAAMAEERSADVILLGAKRRRRWARLAGRGVRERTIRLTALPVITAPAPLAVSAIHQLTLSDLDKLDARQERSISS